MYNINRNDFCKALKQYRKSRGLTLEDLGKKICKTKATVSKYEKGEIIPDIITTLEICNVLDISLSQLFPTIKNSSKLTPNNPFNVDKLYLYYYTENILITSIVEIRNEEDKTYLKLYNGIKNVNTYANKSSYYYEGYMECDKTIGYMNFYNISQGTQLEKLQISFMIPWSKEFKITNFFILALTPNSIPVVKKGILSVNPIDNIDNYINELKLNKNDLQEIKRENAWILENKTYDYFFFNS